MHAHNHVSRSSDENQFFLNLNSINTYNQESTVAHNCHIKFKLLTSNSNRVSDWSAAKYPQFRSFTLPPFCGIVICSVCILSKSPIRNICQAKCTAVILGATLKTANFAEPVEKVREMLCI